MRVVACLAILGWLTSTRPNPLLCECFAEAAYAAIRVQTLPSERPTECCGKCNGTGKVRSGDGLSIVPCPCPPTCKCKQGAGKK